METLLTLDAARTFAGRPESVRAARIWAASYLPGSPAVDDIELMVSELVTSAICYSRSGLPGGAVTVTLTITEGRLRVDVIDQGTGPALPGAAPRLDAAIGEPPGLGIGLVIVRELADTSGADGSDKWFTISLGGT